jgi:feruloyl esterase
LQEPDFKNRDFNVDRDFTRALAAKFSGESLEEVYDSKPDLTAFKARGGKFVLFQGWSDANITPLVDVDYYKAMVAKYGQAATDSFLRFFLLPGMGHCSGGSGFSHIGGATGAPIADDAGHDMVRAMEAWVTQGKAPERFIAAHIDPDKKVTATRPVCRYPLEAQYKGSADIKDAANFTCGLPKDRL